MIWVEPSFVLTVALPVAFTDGLKGWSGTSSFTLGGNEITLTIVLGALGLAWSAACAAVMRARQHVTIRARDGTLFIQSLLQKGAAWIPRGVGGAALGPQG